MEEFELHVPVEQYGFVGVKYTLDSSLGERPIRVNYDLIKEAFAEKPLNTLSDKEFTDIIYGCLHNTKELTADKWEAMNAAQQNMLKCLKNAMSRQKPSKEIAGVDFSKDQENLDKLTIKRK